jgi:Sigma-70, region 4/Putative zinc-finger
VRFVNPSLENAALASLYDRRGAEVFNFCLRVAGSRDVAATATTAAFLAVCREPGLDLLAAARRETARLVGDPGSGQARRRDDPGATPPAVRRANGLIELRHREVLVLRDLLGCSYAEIGEIIGAGDRTAAELLWRARLALHDELNGSRLTSIAPLADSCRRALALIAGDWDGERCDRGERDWLRGHLRTCGKCRVSQKAAREASATYRAWTPAAPPLGMRESLLATAPAARAAAGSGTWSRRPAGSPPPGAPHGARRSPG